MSFTYPQLYMYKSTSVIQKSLITKILVNIIGKTNVSFQIVSKTAVKPTFHIFKLLFSANGFNSTNPTVNVFRDTVQ